MYAIIAHRGCEDSGVVFLPYPPCGLAGWPLGLERQSLQTFLLGIVPVVASATLTPSLPRSLGGLVGEADWGAVCPDFSSHRRVEFVMLCEDPLR